MRTLKKIVLSTAIATAFAAPMLTHAESTFNAAATINSTATAKLNFSIVIPQVLFLRVGTSASNTVTDATVDSLSFTVPADKLGDGTPVAGVGGDLSAGAVTVRVYGNGGDIKLTSDTTGALSNAVGGNIIPWSEIGVVSDALAATTPGYTNQAISHPAFNASAVGGGTSAVPTTLSATNKVVRMEGKWTFSYLNTTPVAAGSYGGTSAQNGQIIYTATQL